MSNLLDFLGRIFISSVFLFSAVNKILGFSSTQSWMEGYGVPGILLWPTIFIEIIFPVLIIIGYKTQISALILAFFSIATALIFHLDLGNQMQVIALLKNFGLAGGFFFLAANGPKNWALDRGKRYVRL